MHGMNRRQFSTAIAATGASGLLPSFALAADPPPETRTLKLKKSYAICFAPYYVFAEFLKAEGFEDIEYVATDDANSLEFSNTTR